MPASSFRERGPISSGCYLEFARGKAKKAAKCHKQHKSFSGEAGLASAGLRHNYSRLARERITVGNREPEMNERAWFTEAPFPFACTCSSSLSASVG